MGTARHMCLICLTYTCLGSLLPDCLVLRILDFAYTLFKDGDIAYESSRITEREGQSRSPNPDLEKALGVPSNWKFPAIAKPLVMCK